MADGFRIAEGYLDIDADPSAALRNVQEFLRQVDRRLHAAEDDAEDSGRRSGRRFGEGLNEGLRGATGGNLINDLVLGGSGGGGGGEGGAGGGGGGGGFIQGLISGLSGGFRRILDEVRDIIAEIESLLSGLGGGGGFLSQLQSDLQDLLSEIRSGFSSVISWLQGTWTRSFGLITGGPVRTFFSDLLTRARGYWTRFTGWASTTFSAMWTRISGWWGSMTSSLSGFWSRFVTWSIVAFGGLRYYANTFWRQFRTWASGAFTGMALVAGILFSRLRSWTSSLFTRMRSGFSSLWGRASTRGRALWTRFAAWGRSALTAIGGWFSSLWTSISAGASAVWTQLQAAFGSIGKVAGQLGPILQIAGMASLVPILLSLGGAIANLLPLLLLLPAAIGVLAGILAPAIVAFKGFGAAVSAGLSGDVEKFNEALKKLTPSARAVAKEFVALGPALKNIKKLTQEALFKQLIGSIKPLATTLLPALATGMAKSAAALGRFLAGFAKMLATPEVISAINTLFATTARILDKLGPPIASLFGALFGTMEGGLPWIERFVDVIANGIQKFADWLRQVKGDGSMQKWLETAWSTAKDFWAVLVQLGLIVKNLFADSGDEGQTFLQGLASSLEKVNKWLTSDDGKDFLDVLASSVVVMIPLLNALVWVLGFTIEALLALKDAGIVVWGWLKSAWAWLSEAVPAIGRWFADLASVSWDWLKSAGRAIADFFSGIGRWFADAYTAVVTWLGKIVDWIGALPGRIGAFFSALPGWIASGLAALRDAVSFAIGYIAGLVVRTFTDMPGAVAQAWTWITNAVSTGATAAWNAVTSWATNVWNSLVKLGSDMLTAVNSAWDWVTGATSTGVQKSTDAVSALPGKAADAISSLPGAIGNWISSAWTQAVSSTGRGIDNVINLVRGIKDKALSALSGAGSWLYNVGADMIRGLVNGLTGMLGWAVDQARAIANKIKDGFLHALDSHSPSRVMDREVGRTILPGVMQGIDHDLPDMMRYLGAVGNLMVQGFKPTVNVAAPTVHTGDTMLSVDLGEGIRQVVPIVIARNPRVVAGAAAVGKRERSGWVNTAR